MVTRLTATTPTRPSASKSSVGPRIKRPFDQGLLRDHRKNRWGPQQNPSASASWRCTRWRYPFTARTVFVLHTLVTGDASLIGLPAME
jgi:hypothetical protein